MSYPNLKQQYYQKILDTLSQKGYWSDFNSHHNLWVEVKKAEASKKHPLLDGSVTIEEPDPDDYPLLD